MTVNNIARNQMSDAMMRIASGQRVNNARDDAAGLAIVEQMTAQVRGLEQGTRNTRDMQALVNTAEGGLDTISDSLNRIRELSVQAANDTNTPASREMIQAEINQLADGIQSAVDNVQFNNINLLDGSVRDFNTASGPDGTGATVNVRDMAGLAQAITNFNVTGEFDIGQIDRAINDVASERANLGALSNRMDHTVVSNEVSTLNLADARSRVRDQDIPAAASALVQERVLEQMQLLMQQQAQNNAAENTQRVVAAGGPGL